MKMRNIKYIILHHSATDYEANKDDMAVNLLEELFATEHKSNGKRNFLITNAIIISS